MWREDPAAGEAAATASLARLSEAQNHPPPAEPAAEPAAGGPPPKPKKAEVPIATFSFEEAHPAVAGAHYLRTHEENEKLLRASQEAAPAAAAAAAGAKSPRAGSPYGRKPPGKAASPRGKARPQSARPRAVAFEDEAAPAARPASARRAAPKPAADLERERDKERIAQLERQILELQQGILEVKSSMELKPGALQPPAPRAAQAPPARPASALGARAVEPYAEVEALADHLAEASKLAEDAAFEEDGEGGGQPKPESPVFKEAWGGAFDGATEDAELAGTSAMASPAEDTSWMERYRVSLGADAGYTDNLEEYEEYLANRAKLAEVRAQASSPAPETSAAAAAAGEAPPSPIPTGSPDRAPPPAKRLMRPRPQPKAREPGHEGCVHFMGPNDLHGDSRPKPRGVKSYHRSTVFKPFSFDARDKKKKKTISQVKLEQDLLLKKEKEEAALLHKFKANALPRSTMEPRYAKIVKQQKERSEQYRRESQKWLMESEKPFSFYYLDQKRREVKEQKLAAAREAKGKPFHANKIPAATYEPRYELLAMDHERRKSTVKQRAAESLAKASLPSRMEMDKRKKAEEPPPYDRSKPYPQVKLGEIPNFDALHAGFEEKLAKARALRRQNLTVPQEFHLGGKSKEEAERRKLKNEMKRQMILVDIELDNEELKETRWPYASTRGKVQKVAPPNFNEESSIMFKTTKAAKLRAENFQRLKRSGQYDSREQKEEKEERQRRKDAERRAAEWVRIQREKAVAAAAAVSDFSMDPLAGVGRAGPGKAAASPTPLGGQLFTKAEKTAARTGVPLQHVQARHKQVASEAHEIVEQALLEQGIDAYKYVEG